MLGFITRSVSLIALALLVSCAGSPPPGPRRVDPGWPGVFGAKPVGLYLVAPRGPYTIAQFEAVSLAGPAFEQLEPGIRWTTIDSGNHKVKKLGGWDLDSLTDLLVQDSAVWKGSLATDSQILRRASAPLSEPTKAALRRVGMAMEVEILVALRPGGAKNPKDSLDSFEDPAWFGIFDLATGEQLYSLLVPVKGSRNSSASAESDWAREAWVRFDQGVREVRRQKP